MSRPKKGIPAKSIRYQYIFYEIGMDYKDLARFSNEKLSTQLDDRIIEIQKELINEIMIIINEQLTKHQTKVMKLILLNKTQVEIADNLGCTQSAVHKCVWGNIDYKNQHRYGGVIKKLQKLSKNNIKIQQCLKAIEAIKAEQ